MEVLKTIFGMMLALMGALLMSKALAERLELDRWYKFTSGLLAIIGGLTLALAK